jgi:hypothetical protein
MASSKRKGIKNVFAEKRKATGSRIWERGWKINM